jgi:hypothetical protein
MHKLYAGIQAELAHDRIIAAAKNLSDRFSVPAEIVDGLTIQERDQMVKPIREAEAVANLLEAILDAPEVPVTEVPAPVIEPEIVTPKRGRK